MSVQKDGRKTFNKSKSNAEGSSPLRIPACTIRIMEFTLRSESQNNDNMLGSIAYCGTRY